VILINRRRESAREWPLLDLHQGSGRPQAHDASVKEALMYRRILVCTDGSRLAQRAAREGLELAARLKASVVALLVTPPFEPPAGYESSPLAAQIEKHERESKKAAARCLGAIERDARSLGVRCRTLHIGRYPPAATIVETAVSERCDLVVMGSHGHGALGQLFLGSVTTRVAATCSVPLLIVRKPPRGTLRSPAAARRNRKS
jgi:nucleotide-binding universal stress UspA family protein